MSALALVVGVALPACSGSTDHSGSSARDESAGDIGLRLVTPGGVTVNSVTYTITGNGITPITGTIDTSASGATASVLVGGIPAGLGYKVVMTAAGSGGSDCSGTSNFDVVAGQTKGVTVALTCGAATSRGNITANGTFNQCPVITSLIVSPLQLDVGGKITVSATASDPDAGSTLTYAWTVVGTGGSFVNATAQTTQFTASVAGTQTLTVSVSDGNGCVTTLGGDVKITTTAICGNGNVEAGEQCEPPNTATCTATCQTRVVGCGNGFVEAPETCDPPNGTTCNAQCKTITCGDSVTEGSEQCDPPKAGFCSATCQNLGAVCGDSILQAGETCDPPNGTTCDATCHTVNQCNSCTTSNCSGANTACNNAANSTGCNAILACIASSGCAVGSLRDGAECYCGPGVDNDACFTGTDPAVPQGVCKGAVETAAGTTVPLTIGQKFFQLTSPVGAAFQTTSCRLSSCQAECSL